MKTHKVSKDFDVKLLELWQRSINSKKKEIEYNKKTKDNEMIVFNLEVLKRLEKRYEEIKNEITKTP